jgi:hypothetical protein
MLVGDPDQLPPVGPGAPLRAAIAAGVVPRVDLREIFRQTADSAIVRSAHAINQGGCGGWGSGAGGGVAVAHMPSASVGVVGGGWGVVRGVQGAAKAPRADPVL